MTRDEHTTNRPTPGGSAFQETGMDDYLTRMAEPMRDATLACACAWDVVNNGPLRSAVKLPAVIADVPRPEPVARVDGADEYGPCLSWHTHWVDLIGANLYAEPVAAPDAQTVASAIRQRILGLPRFSFLSPAGGGVKRVPDRAGNWIEWDAAAALCEPESVDAMLAAAPEAPQTIQCNACNWIGSSSDALYLGGREPIGPLCPACHETTGPADDAVTLRSAIRDMASMLQAREWAEHVSTDPVVTDLEVQITELVGMATTLREQNAALLSELLTLYQGYVNLLESGRDRIIALGGDCDPVDVMERNDPWLISARKVLASAKGGAA